MATLFEPPANPFRTHPNEDPDHLAARQARADYATAAQAVREDPYLSDLAKREQILALHHQHVQAVADAHGRVNERRKARYDFLTDLVPSGPGVSEDTTQADSAVLLTAYRAAAAAVQDAPDRKARAALLAEAERFGDDMMRRAVLTYAAEHGETETVDRWVADTLGLDDYRAEMGQLRGALEGQHTAAPWDWQDFRAEKPPKELEGLPRSELVPPAPEPAPAA